MCVLFALRLEVKAQSNTIGITTSVTSGNWSDATVWSSGSIPDPATSINVNHPVTIDNNISIGGGSYSFSADVIDFPDRTNYTLTMQKAVLDIRSGTTAFGGAASFVGSTVYVRNGATLVLGGVTLNNDNTVVVETGGTLIVNGRFVNSNSSGSFILDGLLQIYGDYLTRNGNLSIEGTGDVYTTGLISNQGSSTVFGSSNNCSPGPCSGRNLCSFNNVIQSSQVICSGGAAMPLTSTITGRPGSGSQFTWEQSTTSSIEGFTTASGTAGAENYSPGVVPETTWYRRKVVKGNCTAYSPPVKLTVQGDGGWRGITTNWNSSFNWCGNTMPTESTDVTINPGVPNQPEITSSIVCHDLIVNPGAFLTISGTNSISIYGDLFNNGIINTNSSSVSFDGSLTQHVRGWPITFYNLTINNTSPNTVIMHTMVNVFNRLTMTRGNVNLSGYNLTLGTSSANRGTLNHITGMIYNGNLTRWFGTSGVSAGSSAGLFPFGNSRDSRNLYVGYSAFGGSGASGGTIKVSHADATTTSDVSFVDDLNIVLKRHDASWRVTTANGLNQGTVTSPVDLTLEGGGFGTVGNVDDLRVTLAGSVVGSAGTNAGSVDFPRVARTALSVNDLNNVFYIGSVDPVLSPLPITLVNFSGQFTPEGVSLEWTATAQVNFDHFVVERSMDGISFERVTKVPGKESNDLFVRYTYLDGTVQGGKFYYRLKMIDIDESYSYSKIIAVAGDERYENVSIYPNPVVDGKFTLKVEGLESTGRFILYDQYGRIYVEEALFNGEQEVVLNQAVPDGIYMVKVAGLHADKIFKLVVRN